MNTKKLNLFFLLIFIFSFSLFAQTIIPNGYTIEDDCVYNSTTSMYDYIDGSQVWSPAGNPYVIEGRVRVRTTLTILPGVIIKLQEDGLIDVEDDVVFCSSSVPVNGFIDAQGTATNPIIFTSYKDDTYAGDTNGDGSSTSPFRGDWGAVVIREDGNGVFDYCSFKYGGRAVLYFSQDEGIGLGIFGTATVDNCHFEENGSTSIYNGQYVGLGVAWGTVHTISNLTFGTNDYIGIGIITGGPAGIFTLPKYTDYPYLINNYRVRIDDDQEIIVQPGTIFKLHDDGLLDVDGKLIAQGISNDEIIFTSLLDDTYGGDTNQDGSGTSPFRGDWGAVVISTAADGIFDYCTFKYGGRAVLYFSQDEGIGLGIFGTATVDNCHFEENGSTSVYNGQHVGLGVAWGAVHTISNLTFGINDYIGIGIITGGPAGIFTLPKYTDYPYLINNYRARIDDDQEIIVQPGTIFKLHDDGLLDVDGKLTAEGTSSDEIIFTSLLDDTYAGDTNRDGSGTSPFLGDWGAVVISTAADGIFDYCTFKYGGRAVLYFSQDEGIGLGIFGTATVDNCHFEENGSNSVYNGRYVGLGVAIGATDTIGTLSYGINDYTGIALLENSSFSGIETIEGYANYPYIINNYNVRIDDDQVININEGTVIKINRQSSSSTISNYGELKFLGSTTNPVVLTSLKDDSYMGDTNRDGTGTSPQMEDWSYLWSGGAISFKNTKLYYSDWNDEVVKFDDASANTCTAGNITLTSMPGFTLTDFTRTVGNLYSKDVFLSGDSLSVTTENSITLQPGFHSKEGSNYKAFITTPCANTFTNDPPVSSLEIENRGEGVQAIQKESSGDFEKDMIAIFQNEDEVEIAEVTPYQEEEEERRDHRNQYRNIEFKENYNNIITKDEVSVAPNPFSSVTTIFYEVVKEEPITIEVFSNTGERVAILLSNVYQESGKYNIEWSANDVNKGIYHIVLTTPSFRNVKKVLLIH